MVKQRGCENKENHQQRIPCLYSIWRLLSYDPTYPSEIHNTRSLHRLFRRDYLSTDTSGVGPCTPFSVILLYVISLSQTFGAIPIGLSVLDRVDCRQFTQRDGTWLTYEAYSCNLCDRCATAVLYLLFLLNNDVNGSKTFVALHLQVDFGKY